MLVGELMGEGIAVEGQETGAAELLIGELHIYVWSTRSLLGSSQFVVSLALSRCCRRGRRGLRRPTPMNN
jgi:hypothetical protein